MQHIAKQLRKSEKDLDTSTAIVAGILGAIQDGDPISDENLLFAFAFYKLAYRATLLLGPEFKLYRTEMLRRFERLETMIEGRGLRS